MALDTGSTVLWISSGGEAMAENLNDEAIAKFIISALQYYQMLTTGFSLLSHSDQQIDIHTPSILFLLALYCKANSSS